MSVTMNFRPERNKSVNSVRSRISRASIAINVCVILAALGLCSYGFTVAPWIHDKGGASRSSSASACGLPSPPQGLPASKLEAWERQNQCPMLTPAQGKALAQQRMRAAAASGPTEPQLAEGESSVDRVIGSPDQLGGVPVPFSPAVTTITNMYIDVARHIEVYAGANVAAPQQGELMVGGPSDEISYYALPGAGGIASLVSLAGQRVVVKDASGNTFMFDVSERQWINS